jgi:hypothetical protein
MRFQCGGVGRVGQSPDGVQRLTQWRPIEPQFAARDIGEFIENLDAMSPPLDSSVSATVERGSSEKA